MAALLNRLKRVPTSQVLAAALAIAVAARFAGLGSSLWYDEVTTLLNFVRLPVGELVADFSSLNNHPLYSLTAKASVSLFGETAQALRLPAAVFGIGAIAAFWPISRRVLTPALALLTLLLLALSYHHVWFSQNARGYTMLLFWTTISTALFLVGARKNSMAIWAGYGAVFAAAMYTHLTAAFYFAAHGAIYAGVLLRRLYRRDGESGVLTGWPPFIGMALGLALTLLVYAPMLGDMTSTFSGVRQSAPTEPLAHWKDPSFVIANLVGQIASLGPFMALVLPPAVILIFFGAYRISRKDGLLAAIYVLQIPITIAVLLLADMRIWPRYFFVEIAFLYLSLVVGVFAAIDVVCSYAMRHWRLGNAQPWLTGVASVAMIIGSLSLLSRNYAAPKQDLAGAVAAIESLAGPFDVKSVYGVAAEPVIGYYAPDWQELSPAMIRSSPRPRRVWTLIAFRDQVAASDPAAWAAFEREFELVERLPGTLGGGGVFVYRSKSP